MIVFFGIVIGVGFFIAQYYGDPSILYIAVAISIVMNFVSFWFSHKIALKMSGAVPATRDQYPELYRTVENLAITAGLPMPTLHIIHDEAPNAFATGRNKKVAAIAVTTGLLSRLEPNELEGVLAHELSHIDNNDILVSTIAVVLVGFISILADIFMRSQIFGGSRDNNRGGVLILVGIALSVLAPLVATFMQLAISRKREYLADASGALLTRYPEGLASALEKIAGYKGKMKKASRATSHLFISNPFGADRAFSNLFSTHPPMEKRVQALREMDM